MWDAFDLETQSLSQPGILPVSSFDAILLDGIADPAPGQPLELLQSMARRPGVSPLMSFTTPAGFERAQQAGATQCFNRERIDHGRLAAALRKAFEDRRTHLQRAFGREPSDDSYRFGPAIIRGQRFIRELATGGVASIYLAHCEKLDEVVVLKVLNHEPEVASAQKIFDRFMLEYELLSRIDHPNVVRIHDLGLADDHAYIAMEYLPAGDLRARLAQPLSAEQAVDYTRQIASALSAVHSVGVLHRDLKPGNVMLRDDGRVALIDFGLAKHSDARSNITAVGQIFGTPFYMSPEQGHGETVNASSDLYSLGVMFFEMLTRRKPFVSRTPMEIIYMHRNTPLPALEGDLEAYWPIIGRMLAKRPVDRFQSANEVLQALDELALRKSA